MKLFVGNMPNDISEHELHDIFSQFGLVHSAILWRMWTSTRSIQFGFVSMPDGDTADAAVSTLDGRQLRGARLRVRPAYPEQNDSDRSPPAPENR